MASSFSPLENPSCAIGVGQSNTIRDGGRERITHLAAYWRNYSDIQNGHAWGEGGICFFILITFSTEAARLTVDNA